MGTFILTLIPIIWVYVVVAVSLNVIVGFTRLLTVAQAAFMGIGAYSTAILSVNHGWPVLATIPVGFAIAAALGAGLMLPALRIRGLLLYAVVSFALMVVMEQVFNNATSITMGASGIAGIPYIAIGSFVVDSNLDYCVFYGVVALLVALLHLRISASPVGLTFRVMREDADAAAAAGINTSAAKLKVFMLGAVLASLAGSLYAPLIQFVDPATFTVFLSFLVISMVVLGGTGNVVGGVLGATLLTIVPNVITYVGLPSAIGGPIAQIIYAVVLILVLRVRPRGVLPERPWRLGRDLARLQVPRGPLARAEDA